MARQLSDDTIRLNIIINGNQAQKEILDLDKSNLKLKQSLTDLNKQEQKLRAEFDKTNKIYTTQKQKLTEAKAAFDAVNASHAKETATLKKLEAENGKATKEYKAQAKVVKELEKEGERLWNRQDALATSTIKLKEQLTGINEKYKPLAQEIAATNAEIDKNTARLDELTSSFRLADMTITQLKNKANQLRAALKHMLPNDQDHLSYKTELDAINARMKQLNSTTKITDMTMGQLEAQAAFLAAALTNMSPDTDDYRQYSAELDHVNTRMQELTGSIAVTAMTMDQLEAKASELGSALKSAVPDSTEYKMLETELNSVRLRIRELNGTLKVSEMNMSQLAAKSQTLRAALAGAVPHSNEALGYVAQLGEVNGRVSELTGNLHINQMSMVQLRARSGALQAALDNLQPNSENIVAYREELEKVNEQMDAMSGESKKASWSLGGMADKVNKYGGLFASFIATLTGVALSIQKILDFNGKLSESYTKVMKTTGMTKREVDALSESFGMLKTRTGRIELLGIAEIGGRLGIAKSEIADFVKVMDKSAVALGDSFEGGPDVVAEKLGRIKGLYKELKDEGVEVAFESVGSALNDLGADGTASEQNLAEFAQRVGTMPEALKPSIQTVLGMGAAFEESGLKAELAGNNYAKVVTIAARDYPAFAKVMGRSAAEVKNLINTDPNEFFLQFSQSLKNLDATDLAQVLDYLKLNDNEVKMVLGAASQNVDLFRQKIQLANQSMEDATSLTNEYNLVNSNLAAVFDRLKKKVIGWFTSDSVVAFITSAVEKLAQLIGAVEDSNGAMSGFKNTVVFTAKVLAILVTGFLSYTTAAKLAAFWSNKVNAATAYSNIVFRIQYAQLVLQQTATKTLALLQALLSGNIARVRVAYQALTVAMGMNPFGALLAVIGAVIAAFVAFKDEVAETTKVMNAMSEIQAEVADQTAATKNKVIDLIKVIKSENATYEQKQKALEQLKKIGGEYLETLNMENLMTAEGERLMQRYIRSVDQLAMAKAAVNVKAKLAEQKLESDNKILALSMEKDENTNEGAWGQGDDGKLFGLGDRNKKEIQSEIDAEKKSRDLIDKQIKALYQKEDAAITYLQNKIRKQKENLKKMKVDSDAYKELMLDIRTDEETVNMLLGLNDVQAPEEVQGAVVPVKEDKKAANKAASLAARLKADRLKRVASDREENKKYQQEVLDFERRAIDDRLALLQDGFDKEDAIESENHKRKLEDLKKQLVDEAQIALLDEKINDPKATPLERGVASETKRIWLERNKHLNELIEIEHGRHRFAMETIDLKAETKSIADLQQNFDRETTLRQAKHNEELAALGTNEIAKQKLQDAFDKEELDRQTAHLEKLLALKQDILADKNNQIDLDLLTPEQKQQIEDEIAALKLKLSEITEAKSQLQNKAGSNDINKAGRKAFGDQDILGFTPDQWEKTFSSLDTLTQKLQATGAVIAGLQNIWGLYDQFRTASDNAQLRDYEKNSDTRKKRLKSQLDNGYINQTQYNRSLEKLDADLEKKKAEIEYKQAKRDKVRALFDAGINTAKGITAAIPNVFLMAMAAAAGALQIATIAKTPLPAKGYEKGLYPEYVKREQDGKTFRAGYGGNTRSGMVNKPTYFLAGENGPEMVIDAAAYRQMSPDTKAMLIRELRGIKGFEKGYYNNDVTGGRYEVPAVSGSAAPSASGSLTIDQALAIINRNTEILEKIHSEGITAYVSRDARELKKLREEMDRITQSKLKAQS